MVIQQMPQRRVEVAYQMTTTNQSFLDMHHYLRHKGISHNKFFLVLYDTDLLTINPRDPKLNQFMKKKILAECIRNYWYFIREVVRIPVEGGEVNSGISYKLHRGNLALNFGFVLNWNMFLELPRQHGKTISAIVRYLWCFLFGTRNSEFMFLNKKFEDSKLNLQRLKDIRASLPDYLQLDAQVTADGKKIKKTDRAESLSNPLNNNRVKTAASARSKTLANSLGRGCTMPIQWYDEYAFIPFNGIVYSSATPAFSKASANAKENGSPYGILITTTPGDLLTDEGADAFQTKEEATLFSEKYYDMTLEQLSQVLSANTKNNFVYMRFTYQQLGSDEEYFDQMVKELRGKWTDIRREVMLEWAEVSSNSPFDKVDLDQVKSLLREPIREIMVGGGKYIFKVYDNVNLNNPPIIGVDVAGGYQRDSSAIAVIDSKTTKLFADFRCNYIPVLDLAKVIYEIVSVHMPRAIVNVEHNGGYGAAVIQYLLSKPNIKHNLYYEIKDKVFEERFDGLKNVKTTKKVKTYGLYQTSSTRETLMEILRERMRYHKDKFVSKDLYQELCSLEVKKNGRIEHSANGHDDLVFAYLLALYVWYEGKDVASRFGIEKGTIRTEDVYDVDEELGTGTTYVNTVSTIEILDDEDDSNEINNAMNLLNKSYMTHSEFINKQHRDGLKYTEELIYSNPLAMKAYCDKYHTSLQDMRQNNTHFQISDEVLASYGYGEEKEYNPLQEQFNTITNLR